MDVTYGVLNYNPNNDPIAKKHFLACVESLAHNRSDHFKSEVYLIDQGGPEEQSELITYAAKTFGFQAITLRSNVGISRGINLLANIARGKYISLVTSDTIFPKYLDIRMIDILSRNSDIYQICPASYKAGISYQCYEANKNTLIKCLGQELTIQFWPRSTFEKIGFFEEKFKAKYENLDYALRAYIHGGYVAIDHTSVCEHVHNMTSKNGSINHAYDGYISKEAIDRGILKSIWDSKWLGLDWNMLYNPSILTEQFRETLKISYSQNIHLPYIQNVGY